jgi:hypothetical protein
MRPRDREQRDAPGASQWHSRRVEPQRVPQQPLQRVPSPWPEPERLEPARFRE